MKRAAPGLRLNEHLEADGPTVFAHACKMGLEGIVSKRKDSRYRSGRSPDWVKSKNPAWEAVRREAEEDWRKTLGTQPGTAEGRALVRATLLWAAGLIAGIIIGGMISDTYLHAGSGRAGRQVCAALRRRNTPSLSARGRSRRERR